MRRLDRLWTGLGNRVRPILQERKFIRDWHALSDIEIASGALATEAFRKNVRALELNRYRRLLVLAPHQDDELIGAGGTLLLAKGLGGHISVLFLTDGGGHEDAEAPASADQDAGLVAVRRREAQAVCSRLGAEYHELGISNARMNASVAHVLQLKSVLQRVQPDVILVPWLLDAAPKHRIANHLLWMAARGTSEDKAEVWGYQVNNAIWANGYVDISDTAEEKRTLLRMYESQLKNIRRYDHIADGLAAWNSRVLPSRADADGPRYAELFSALPLAEHLRLTERFYFRDLRRTYHAKTLVGTQMIALHKEFGRSGGLGSSAVR